MEINPQTARPETLISALLYMMTLYQRTRCTRLASSIAAHLDCLSRHAEFESVVREVADGMCDEWHLLSCYPTAIRQSATSMTLN